MKCADDKERERERETGGEGEREREKGGRKRETKPPVTRAQPVPVADRPKL